MPSNIALFFSQPQAAKTRSKEPPKTQHGPLLLQLLHDHSPALMDALETKDSAALGPLLWKSPKRSKYANSKRLDVGCPNPDGDTLLLRTAVSGDYPTATKALIRAGAQMDKRDPQGRDAITLNTLFQHPKALKVLLAHAATIFGLEDIRNLFDEDPAFDADPAPLTLKQDKEGNTALWHAVKAENHDALYLLTDAGINLNEINKDDVTALNEAAKQGNTYACLRLLRNHADSSIPDKEGKTPLMHWIKNIKITSHTETTAYFVGRPFFLDDRGLPGFYRASEELIRASRPHINAQDHDGKTALSHLAESPICTTYWGVEGSKALILNRANVDLPDRKGLTPVMHFAKIKPTHRMGDVFTHTAVFRKSQDINRQDNQGKTALIHAAENGNLQALAAIILGNNSQNILGLSPPNQGANVNPNIHDSKGRTALMALSALDAKEFNGPVWTKVMDTLYQMMARRVSFLTRPLDTMPIDHPLSNCAQLLLLAEAEITRKDHAGQTTLMIAAQTGNLPVLKVLCKYPETLEQRDLNKETALQLAKKSNQPEAVAMLLAAGAKPEA